MAKAMDVAKARGLEIGGIEVAPDGTIRVLAKNAAELTNDDLGNWIAKRNAHQT